MDLTTLAQLILLILRNLNFKPRKHKLEDIAYAIAAYLLGVQVTKLGIPPSTLYYYTKKLGVKRRKEEKPPCPSCNSNKVIKNGSSRGKAKYKCKTCGRTFYQTPNHKMSREQKERILNEYLNRASIRGIARVEGKPLTTVYSLIKRKGVEAYVNLLVLQEQLKSFTAKVTVIDESWTYLRVRHGPKRENLWIWNALADGLPFFTTGDRDYKTFSFLLNSLPKSEVNYTDDYSVYQVLDNHIASKKYTYTVESYHSYYRAHLARLARDTRAVNRSKRMVDYSLALLNVMYPHVFSREKTPLNEAYLREVQNIRENLI
ncbi:IS1 family transposase [Saccharolobus caldissimus]|uniref:IS1 transposase n=1 Tax=Saccharolobus caldissimus TaxID=1702097 RepID=A0AAQ4CRS6_9CREN|nr:IS1 family transposase [Saccharolobus caldissimus]BDB98497.1 IS1 transposase [Saccharolobus caldissimus]BDB98507.1 IS1 transposase [Saccharolobus caldissimus]